MTAKEQLLRARELGHELTVETRSRPDIPEALDKFWVSCTCGYRSTSRRTRAQVNGVLIWHLGKVMADSVDRVNGA